MRLLGLDYGSKTVGVAVSDPMGIGATAVEIGAANLTDPFACLKIIGELPQAMDRYGIKELKELGGAV